MANNSVWGINWKKVVTGRIRTLTYVLLWYIVVVTPLSSVYRIMLVICDAFAGPDLAIKHILSYLILQLCNFKFDMYCDTRKKIAHSYDYEK